jgi:DNA-binding SARP family transcriptional activator
MRVNLLGTFSAYLNGVPIAPDAGKPCKVLALLAIQPGRTVSTGRLRTELWGDTPPASATTTLQTYIHKLRRHIERGLGDGQPLTANEYLSTERGGYALHLRGGTTDKLEFERLALEGDLALAEGDALRASDAFRRALSLHRGPLLADLPLGPHLDVEGIALEDHVRAVRIRRIAADLLLNRHHDLLPEMRLLVAENPLNESLSAHYMTCLYRAGQVGPALNEYWRLRESLREELGVEPMPMVRKVQSAILNSSTIPNDALLAG